MRKLLIVALATIAAASVAQAQDPPRDLVLTKRMSTPLTEPNVGKPLWALNAQCAGAFGASHSYSLANFGARRAEDDKQTGVAMLNTALYRLQSDRGISRAEALELVKVEVEVGRAKARRALAEGTSAYSLWGLMRSTCLDLQAGAVTG
jgi:hypothetical protein